MACAARPIRSTGSGQPPAAAPEGAAPGTPTALAGSRYAGAGWPAGRARAVVAQKRGDGVGGESVTATTAEEAGNVVVGEDRRRSWRKSLGKSLSGALGKSASS